MSAANLFLPDVRNVLRLLTAFLTAAGLFLTVGKSSGGEPAPQPLPKPFEITNDQPALLPRSTPQIVVPGDGGVVPAAAQVPMKSAAATASDGDDQPGDTKANDKPKQPVSALKGPPGDPPPAAPPDFSANKRSADAAPASSPAQPRDAIEPPPLSPLAVEQAAFKGVTPGVSKIDDVKKLWGDGVPAHSKDGATHLIFKIEPYRRVEVTLVNDLVASITVQLDKPFETDVLLKQLHLEQLVAVAVPDDTGQPLGQAIPERGILLSFAPETKLVTQMLIEPIDAEPFVLRAAARADVQIRRSLQDLDCALQLEPKSARAHELKGRILLGIGKYDEAQAEIEESLKLDPTNLHAQLAKAEVHARRNEHAEAESLVKGVLANPAVSPVVKAAALNELGDLAADGPDHDYKQAIELHLSAIKAAQPLAADHHIGVRREAKRVMVEAHLGAACDIGLGVWQQKEQTAIRWINRASEIAKDLIQNEQGDPQLRLHVARRALDARVGIQGKWDGSDWTVKSLEDGQKLILSTDDPLRAERLQWEMGLALFDIAELDQFHGLTDHSLADSKITLKYIEEGSKHRQQTVDDVFLFGRMYAHVGVVEATQQKNQKRAIVWFDKAAPLLDRPLPPTAKEQLGRNGELFVSMGISYWEVGRRDEALRLTQKGADLMTRAVEEKLLDESAMAIPYGNLAAMHRQLGHFDEARRLAETATRLDEARRK